MMETPSSSLLINDLGKNFLIFDMTEVTLSLENYWTFYLMSHMMRDSSNTKTFDVKRTVFEDYIINPHNYSQFH